MGETTVEGAARSAAVMEGGARVSGLCVPNATASKPARQLQFAPQQHRDTNGELATLCEYCTLLWVRDLAANPLSLADVYELDWHQTQTQVLLVDCREQMWGSTNPASASGLSYVISELPNIPADQVIAPAEVPAAIVAPAVAAASLESGGGLGTGLQVRHRRGIAGVTHRASLLFARKLNITGIH